MSRPSARRRPSAIADARRGRRLFARPLFRRPSLKGWRSCNPEEIGLSVRLVFLLSAGQSPRGVRAQEPAPYGPAARSCDDGGAGGVIIDGVCL